MNAPKPNREPSLLERAAKVYDFTAYARPATTVNPVTVAPTQDWAPSESSVPAQPSFAAEDAGDLSGIPAEFLRPVGAELPEDFGAPPMPSEIVAIDRGRLAEMGMIVPGAPVGPLAEEFRLVKRQLTVTRLHIAEAGDVARARSILVCSARPGEGKTFCAVNLALSMAAERDTEILLIDADFAKPDVPKRLGFEPGRGLLDALGDASIDVETLVAPTDVANLSILPAGAKTAMDTELLASARTRTVIARLLAANPRRILIFDSPPALAASPAAVLAMMVGQIVMVVRADRTPENEIGQAVGLLDGCEHIQLLLNAVAFIPGGQRFGSYYGLGGE